MSTYELGAASLKELEGVHADLVAVVTRAIRITAQDFAVHDGMRTLAQQKKLVEAGASLTMASRHITGHAVDLVPYVNGKLRWEWEPLYRIAEAVPGTLISRLPTATRKTWSRLMSRGEGRLAGKPSWMGRISNCPGKRICSLRVECGRRGKWPAHKKSRRCIGGFFRSCK